MKIEIEVNDPADIKAIMNVLAGGGASTEDSVERTEKFLAAAEEKPKKRGPGRPRMTEEEKAEAARKRAEAKKQKEKEEAAAAAAADADEDEEDEEPADEGRALALDDGEDDAESDASDSDEDDSDDADDEDPMEKAVALATKYLRDGNGKEVRRALKAVGASRVSDLKGKKVQEFLDLIESI